MEEYVQDEVRAEDGGELETMLETLPELLSDEDAVWTEHGLQDPWMRHVDLASLLAERGYLVIRSAFHRDICSSAFAESEELEKFREDFKQETIVEYMGHDNCTLGFMLEDNEATNTLAYLEQLLTHLAWSIAPAVGGTSVERCMVRTPFRSRQDELMAKPLPFDWEDRDNKTIEHSIQFLRRRKLCMLLIMDCEGGKVTLHRGAGEGAARVAEVEAMSNRLIIFDPVRLSFSYKPEGESISIQTWVLGDEIVNTEHDCTVEESVELDIDQVQVQRLSGVAIPPGGQTFVMANKTRGPGNGVTPYLYWNMAAGSTDCSLEWPATRGFDIDVYYHDEENGPGGMARDLHRSYTKHGAFLSDSQMFDFDHDFFGYSHKESKIMAPGHRIFLEIGYDCLYATGFRRSWTANRDIGIYTGDAGADWHAMDACWNDLHGTDDLFAGMLGVNSLVLPGRLCRFANLTGPVLSCSTACSSSLVAMSHACHEILDQPREYIIAGINTMLSVVQFLSFSAQGMLSKKGRCFTYNDSADGFMRGEGLSCCYLQWCTDADSRERSWACVAGSFVNQDGRSASLTAPHGPSQTKMIKTSLKMSGLVPNEVNIGECHGTGTALGDPIEVGAIQSAIGKRTIPYYLTSAKSIHGHLEAGAGLLGFSKCLMMIRAAACPGNVHFSSINPNLMFDGFPCAITSELSDTSVSSTCCGVSSFGATGTNGRADVMGPCYLGVYSKASVRTKKRNLQNAQFISKPCPICSGPMCWLCGLAKPLETGGEPHRCSRIREVGADYACCSLCYSGEHRYVEKALALEGCPEDAELYITGSWDAWSSDHKMAAREGQEGSFEFDVVLGDTCVERFKIKINKSGKQALYPEKNNADTSVRISGPGEPPGEASWMIDGRDESLVPGSVVQVVFTWRNGIKRIDWKPTAQTSKQDFVHEYAISGSWIGWKPRKMALVKADPDEMSESFEATIDIGPFGWEAFRFIRDKDASQIIHPAFSSKMQPPESVSQLKFEVSRLDGAEPTPAGTQVKGPDDNTCDTSFVVRGEYQTRVSVVLTLQKGEIIVRASSAYWSTTWRSGTGWQRHKFYATGNFNSWGFSEMAVCANTPGTFMLDIPVERQEVIRFQIAEDMDAARTLWPSKDDADSGEAIVEGPSVNVAGKCWQIVRPPGAHTMRILLDLKATDKRNLVTWQEISPWML
jgi:polyketide synthase-associated protein